MTALSHPKRSLAESLRPRGMPREEDCETSDEMRQGSRAESQPRHRGRRSVRARARRAGQAGFRSALYRAVERGRREDAQGEGRQQEAL
jgi:hypothetical protein